MGLLRGRKHPMFPCPFCGAAVRMGAPACRGCGSDIETGWSEERDSYAGDPGTGYGGDDDFDYEAWLRRELDEGPAPRRWRASLPQVCLAVALVAFLLAVFWPR